MSAGDDYVHCWGVNDKFLLTVIPVTRTVVIAV